jgi:hypothetical protein
MAGDDYHCHRGLRLSFTPRFSEVATRKRNSVSRFNGFRETVENGLVGSTV